MNPSGCIVNYRKASPDIELQATKLRLKNDIEADVVYRKAVRATIGSAGLMELACPVDWSPTEGSGRN